MRVVLRTVFDFGQGAEAVILQLKNPVRRGEGLAERPSGMGVNAASESIKQGRQFESVRARISSNSLHVTI